MGKHKYTYIHQTIIFLSAERTTSRKPHLISASLTLFCPLQQQQMRLVEFNELCRDESSAYCFCFTAKEPSGFSSTERMVRVPAPISVSLTSACAVILQMGIHIVCIWLCTINLLFGFYGWMKVSKGCQL